MLYPLLKLLHVIGAIVWAGGASTMAVLNARLARADGAAAGQLALARASQGVGQVVLGPAAGITLLSGIATAAAGGIDLSTLWTLWGFAGVAASAALGGTAIRRTTVALEGALSTPARHGSVAPLRRRLTRLNLVNLAVLFSTVAAMVLKPAL
jgi:hypothetical protein